MLVTITGPTCAGKTTFYRELEQLAQAGQSKISFAFIPTYTNRPKRKGDYGYKYVNQYYEKDYFQTNELAGYKYGTKKADIVKLVCASRIPITIITPEALNDFSKVCEKLHLKHIKCFITGSTEVLVERLIYRSAEEVANVDIEFCKTPINDFIKRVDHLLTVELEQWEQENVWDYVIKDYTRENRISAAADFLEYLEKELK